MREDGRDRQEDVGRGGSESASHFSPFPYFHCLYELVLCDRLVYKGDRVTVPLISRTEMKETLSESHREKERTLRGAIDCHRYPSEAIHNLRAKKGKKEELPSSLWATFEQSLLGGSWFLT